MSPAITDATPTAPPAVRARADLAAGARAMLPWLVGVVPFGLVIGVTVGTSAVDPGAGLASGPTIYSGSAQLAALGLLEQGAAPLVAIATVLALNARLVFYSGALAPRWRGTSPWFRGVASYLLVDPSYAVGARAYAEHPGRPGHLRYLGAGLTLWVAWQAAIAIGYLAGTGVPESLHLEHAIPLFLLAEVAHSADARPARTAAAAGGLVAVAASALPLHLGPLVGIAAGLAAGRATDGRSQ